MRRENSEPAQICKTLGEVFDDGSILEAIRPNHTLRLLLWDRNHISIADKFRKCGALFIPPKLAHEVEALRLPSEALPYKSVDQLRDDLKAVFSIHPGLTEESISLVTSAVFATWFADFTTTIPLLSFAAADTYGAELLFRLLECTCRRPARLVESTSARIFSLADSIQPTFLIDTLKPTESVKRALYAVSRRGACVPRDGHLRETGCPVIVGSGTHISDPWFLDNAIQITVHPTRTSLQINRTGFSKLVKNYKIDF